MYTEIEKVRKRIPCHVPLLGVSATMTKSTCSRVIAKAGSLLEHRLMQTSLDRPEIMQIHRFIDHPKASCLNLQLASEVCPAGKKHSENGHLCKYCG